LLRFQERITATVSEDVIRPILLVPAYAKLDNSRARERIADAYAKSPQLGIITALYYYCRRYGQGARPKELRRFLSNLGIQVKDNYLRAELSYLVRKGVVEKVNGRYRLREGIKVKDIESLIDFGRSVAGRIRWIEPRHRDWRPKYSESISELTQKYNIYNLREHIKALIREDERRALSTLIALGGGLRPSDRVEEIGLKGGSFYMIVYEPKLGRYRLICEEYDVLWRKLLEDREIREWLARLIEELRSIKEKSWRNDAWMKLWAAYVDRNLRRKARRIYLAYQSMCGLTQAFFISKINKMQLVVGPHIDVGNDEYYIISR